MISSVTRRVGPTTRRFLDGRPPTYWKRASSSLSSNATHPGQTRPPSGAAFSSTSVGDSGDPGRTGGSHNGGGTTDGTKKAWQPEDNIDIQRVTQQAIIHDLTKQQQSSIEDTVKWFLHTMPPSYFRQVPWDTRMDHIKAISAVKDANVDLDLNLTFHAPDGRLMLTYIRPDTKAGRLLEMVKELPWNHSKEGSYLPLTKMLVFSSMDGSMSLNTFTFGHEKQCPNHLEEAGRNILTYAESVQDGQYVDSDRDPPPSDLFDREGLIEYMRNCSESYITQSEPRRFLKQRMLFEMVTGSEDMAVSVEKADVDDTGQFWVDIAVANSFPQVALEHACRLLYMENFDVGRAHLDVVSDGDNGKVTFLRMRVSAVDNGGAASAEEIMERLPRQLKRMKWLDPTTIDLVFDRYPWLRIRRGEVVTAMCSLLHPILAKKNPIVYSKANIMETITKERYIPLAASIADLFMERFDPRHPLNDSDLLVRSEELLQSIESDVEDSLVVELLAKMIEIIRCTYRTNLYLEDRYALAFRLDPTLLAVGDEGDARELPYGVVFTHGRRFNGFHVRFRDIARGGMRLVTPHTPEQYALESARHYDECYDLAFAQQSKNKDIPEGGSKAVCLINLSGLTDLGKKFVMRKSVKAFTDTILDLIVDTEETRSHVVDYLGKKEVIYLGPDEQVIPDDINWVVARAEKRGYDTPAAFMSSKPRAGINHKEYGVTSEGVNVFLDVALRHTLGINPEQQPFTVKLTGGPDGDVAGNEIKILVREYGGNAKIVGLADHSGCAEDTDGLDHEELLRLVHNDLCVSNFDESKLGPKGEVHTLESEEGMKKRNTMHNRVEADAFIPAGGRPNTIDIHNYRNFLKEDGTPSSPLIVEAANIFITPDARQALFDEAGVMIVKDSSANKCGVICSSYEICAAMMLSEDEFFKNKDVIVDEVLDKLRKLAKMEAELLFREFDNYPGSLIEFSQIISNTINTTKDALIAALDSLSEAEIEKLMPLFLSHLPKTLADLAFDRLKERVPEQYIRNAIASSLASKMVYKEGTKFMASLNHDALARIALRYIQKEKEVAALQEALERVDMPEKEKRAIIDLLEAGGARTALSLP